MTAEPGSPQAAESGAQPGGPKWLAVTTVLGLVVVGVIVYGHVARAGWVGVADKTVWDYLELLIVPAALAVGGYWLNRAQERERQAQEAYREREREVEAEQRQREREATEEARRAREREAQAAQRERELEVENLRAQDATLRAYLDNMSELVIDKELHKKVGKYEPTRVTARARTLVAMAQLNGERKRSIVQFLYEAHTINAENKPPDNTTESEPCLVGLSGADLKDANLRYLTLEYAAFNGAVLENADLRDTRLSNIDLGGTYLSGANLRRADLSGASMKDAQLQCKDWLNLTDADLTDADLSGADLTGAVVTSVQLESARSLQGATLPDGTVHD